MTIKPPKPSDIRPHDGSVLAGAIHLKLTDMLIRQRLKQLEHENPTRFDATIGGPHALRELVYGETPIPHPLRVMLAAVFDIECQFADDADKILRSGV